MKHKSSENSAHIHFLLCTKGSHQSTNFYAFECSGENSPNSSSHFPNHKSVFLQISHHSSLSWKISTLYFLISTIICFGHKESIKVQIVETFECLSQMCQIYHANFETTIQFPFNVFIILQFQYT